jgi:hypothetical protein
VSETLPSSRPETQANWFSRRAAYLTVLLLGVAQAVWLTWIGVPCVTSDHAVYHSPAAELVEHGRLIIPGFGHLFPRTDVAFACYPPLYQFLVAGWYFLFGFSLRTALAFNFVAHILNALAIMRITDLSLSKTPLTPRVRILSLLAVGVIQLGYLVHFDRQEETALLFVWAEILFCQGLGWRRATGSGLCIALAALICPFVGILAAMVVGFRAFFQTWRHAAKPADWIRSAMRLAYIGLVAALPVAGWVVYLETRYPGILNDQFFGTLRWIAAHNEPASLANNTRIFFSSFFYCRPQAPIFLATLALFPWFYRLSVKPARQPLLLALYVTTCLTIALLACIRPEATTYISAVEILFLPCFIPAFARYLIGDAAARRFGLILLTLFVAFASYRGAQWASLPWRWGPGESPDEACRRLHEVIPAGELVNITGRHWYCFQGRNPWREAYFMQDELELLNAKWLVLAQGIGLPPFIDAYELVEQVPLHVDREQSYAYSIWRRRAK